MSERPPIRVSGSSNLELQTRSVLAQALAIVWLLAAGQVSTSFAEQAVSSPAAPTNAPSKSTLPALTNDWSSIDLETSSDCSAAIGADGTIYFGTFTGRLWALNPDGSKKWTFRAEREIYSSPAVGRDGTIYFGSRDRKFYAVGADGRERWRFETKAWVDASPALAQNGMVYFGSWDKDFYALNPDGSQHWRFSTAGEIVSSAAIDAIGVVYFGSHDGRLYAIGPDGRKKWDYATGGPIVSSPALNLGKAVYFTSVDGFFYALNLDGTLQWRIKTGGATASSPVIGTDGTIYVGVNTNYWAITPEGKRRWQRSADALMENSALVLADGTHCFVSRLGLLVGSDPDCRPLWTSFLSSYGYASPAVDSRGHISVPSYHYWFSLRPPTSAPFRLGQTPWPKFRGNPRNTGNVADIP